MTTPAQRVAARFLVAKGLGLGDDWENGKVRIHRFRDMFHIWDLTNAGKRGKKVDKISFGAWTVPNEKEWMEQQSRHLVLNARDFGSITRYIEGVDIPGIEVHRSQKRGIDVLPGGTRKIKLQWSSGTTKLRLEADPLDFMVVSSALIGANEKGQGGFRQDTGYHSEKKAGAKRFYGWLASGGEAKVKRMSISDLQDIWRELKVPYRSH